MIYFHQGRGAARAALSNAYFKGNRKMTTRFFLSLFFTAAALANPVYAQMNLSNVSVCRRALNADRSGWIEGSDYTQEANRRGLTFRACNEMPPSGAENIERPYDPKAAATRREFLEAATYFITALDVSPRKGDTVSDSEIRLGNYPIVIYSDDAGCAVRVRTTTTPYTIWQIDFCKISRWDAYTRYGHTTATWYGDYTAFCLYREWDKNENYTGTIDATNARCGFDGSSETDDRNFRVWVSVYDINDLVNVNGKGRMNGPPSSRRPIDRMIASFKYIVTLKTGKPY